MLAMQQQPQLYVEFCGRGPSLEGYGVTDRNWRGRLSHVPEGTFTSNAQPVMSLHGSYVVQSCVMIHRFVANDVNIDSSWQFIGTTKSL